MFDSHRHSSVGFIVKRMDTHIFVKSLWSVDSAESVDNSLFKNLKIKKYNIEPLGVTLHCRSRGMDT